MSDFRNSEGQPASGFLAYLQDIAFQRHIVGLALPGMKIHSFLMLADKSRIATVDGLNQRFRVKRNGKSVAIDVAPGTDESALGEPILAAVPLDDVVRQIRSGTLKLAGHELPFDEAVRTLALAYREDAKITPIPSRQCRACEFKAAQPPAAGEPRSGFHECWRQAFGWQNANFANGTLLDMWNFRRMPELLAQGVLKPSQLTMEDIGFDGSEPGADGMSTKHRHWYQAHGEWPGGGEYWFDTEGVAAEMAGWRYPLHFIDFETCAVAIPYKRGQRPYETVAFQFSHHVMESDGRVRHATQFLETTPGVDPTLAFLRELRNAVGRDEGTIFRWAAHENTVLNQLRKRLLAEPDAAPDRDELVAFIESITTRKEDKVNSVGPRNMVDLCKLAERWYFHPSTRGSSSLKKVLPALMQSSDWLRRTYGQPIYGTDAMPSLNHTEPFAWWVQRDGKVQDPYKLLRPVFGDVGAEELEAIEVGIAPELAEGGAAMAAYARLQFEEIAPIERQKIQEALFRYCELDTLAMVMAVQAWQDWCAIASTTAPA